MGWIVGICIGLGWLAYKSIMLFAQLLWIMLKGLIWVTEVSVRLVPSPEQACCIMASFDDVGRAGNAVADVIAAGSLILRRIMDLTGADHLVVSEHDILDGIAWSIAEQS